MKLIDPKTFREQSRRNRDEGIYVCVKLRRRNVQFLRDHVRRVVQVAQQFHGMLKEQR